MTLMTGQYGLPIEKAMETVDAARYRNLLPPPLLSLATIPASLLPALAYSMGVYGNIEHLPENIQRTLIIRWHELHAALGTQAAIQLMVDILDIAGLEYHFTYDNETERWNITVNITPPAYARGNEGWGQYATGLLTLMIPWLYNVQTVNVESGAAGDIYLHGMVRPYTLLWNDGGQAINS